MRTNRVVFQYHALFGAKLMLADATERFVWTAVDPTTEDGKFYRAGMAGRVS